MPGLVSWSKGRYVHFNTVRVAVPPGRQGHRPRQRLRRGERPRALHFKTNLSTGVTPGWAAIYDMLARVLGVAVGSHRRRRWAYQPLEAGADEEPPHGSPRRPNGHEAHEVVHGLLPDADARGCAAARALVRCSTACGT